MRATQFHYAWSSPPAARRFRTAVSLHSHTLHSKESLDFVPRLARAVPILRDAVAHQECRYARRFGHPPDYASAYWTPPLSEREALRLEHLQIEETLGRNSLVSLTDHDSIEAPMHLQLLEESKGIPISVEWTVPYGPSFFHLGVHNLAPEESRSWMEVLAHYTQAPSTARLHELLAALHALPEILIVLNHPFWDEKGIGPQSHLELVQQFLRECGQWIHALELNGMRLWRENLAVMKLARATGHCVISGGDRHGCEPNAVLNLTNAETFPEFVEEVREDGISDVLIMSQYRDSLQIRYIEAIWDIVRDYPEQTGRVRWMDRVFYRSAAGETVPLARSWQGDGPGIVGVFMALMRVCSSRHVRSTLRRASRLTGELVP